MNYSAGAVKGVQVYNVTSNKIISTTNLKTYTWSSKLDYGKIYKFKIRSYVVKGGKTYYSNWSSLLSVKMPTYKTITLKKVKKLKKRSNYTVLKTFSKSNSRKIGTINSGKEEKVPQAFCQDGNRYIVQFSRHNSDSYGRLISYKKSLKRTKTGPSLKLGHANGVTCDKSLDKIYSVNRGGTTATVINKKTFKKEYTKTLPMGAYSIAYDNLTNQFYIGNGGRLKVLNSKLKNVRTISLKRSYTHTQDMGAYHGVLMQVYSNGKNGNNYIDMYRAKDGAYLGSYKVNFGELESVIVDNGYLVMLVNMLDTSDDYIYKSKNKVFIP